MVERESSVEDYFVASVKRARGFTRKLRWIGRRSAPDRYVALRRWKGFVELKRPGKRAEAAQAREHDKMLAHGIPVLVLDTREKIDAFIRAYA